MAVGRQKDRGAKAARVSRTPFSAWDIYEKSFLKIENQRELRIQLNDKELAWHEQGPGFNLSTRKDLITSPGVGTTVRFCPSRCISAPTLFLSITIRPWSSFSFLNVHLHTANIQQNSHLYCLSAITLLLQVGFCRSRY